MKPLSTSNITPISNLYLSAYHWQTPYDFEAIASFVFWQRVRLHAKKIVHKKALFESKERNESIFIKVNFDPVLSLSGPTTQSNLIFFAASHHGHFYSIYF